jgi:hypothetical protein
MNMMTAPIVAAGAGAELDDRWAGRLVDQWWAYLDACMGAADIRAASAVKNSRSGFGGNPKSQIRAFEMLKNSLADVLLASFLRAGKRARYHAILDHLFAFEADEAKQLICLRRHLYRKGPASELQVRDEMIFTLTRHALIRLVQRGGIERVTDLRIAVRAAWGPLAIVEAATRQLRIDDPNRTWLVPAHVADGQGYVAFVCCGSDDPSQPLIVKTVLAEDMLRPDQLNGCDPLLQYFQVTDPLDQWDGQTARDLLKATQSFGRLYV